MFALHAQVLHTAHTRLSLLTGNSVHKDALVYSVGPTLTVITTKIETILIDRDLSGA